MKKEFVLVTLFAVLNLGAKSVKIKVAELRTALAEHAKSEVASWTLLKELDKRMSKLEEKAEQYNNENEEQTND